MATVVSSPGWQDAVPRSDNIDNYSNVLAVNVEGEKKISAVIGR